MQNLKIAFAFLCATLIVSTQLIAQFDFRKGFILTSKGDSISGFIKDQPFEKLSKQVVFKMSRKGSANTFSATELLGFGFDDGDVFESSEIDYTTATRKGKTTDVSIVRFLNRVADGKIALYELTENEMPLFIKKENGRLQLLCLQEVLVATVYDENGVPQKPQSGQKYKDSNGRRLVERDGQFYQITNEYINVLKSEIADCDKVKVKDDLPLTRNAILELVMKYNKYCAPEAYQRFLDRQNNALVGRFTVYTSMPMRYFNDFGGVGAGAMIELGDGPFSANFGAEYVIGKKNTTENIKYNYKLLIATLRGNYRPFKNKKMSPYLFAGVSMNATAQKVYIENIQRRNFIKLEVGAGVDYMIGDRFFVKGEVAYPHFPNVRLGVGMLIR